MTESKYERIMSAVRTPPDRPEEWKQYWRFPLYEVSDKGRHRRIGSEDALSQRLNAPKPPYYWLLDFRTAGGERVTVSGQVAVLEAFTGIRCPPGLESLHGEYGSLVNWRENLSRGTRKQNEAEKEAPVTPTFPCRYQHKCGNTVTKEDGSCGPCSEEDGRRVGRMLADGMNLEVAAVRISRSSDWAYKIAVDHGGYTGTKRQARLQQPSVTQRLRITLRDRRADGWGDGATGGRDAA